VRNLVLDTIGHYFSQKYHNRVIQVVLHYTVLSGSLVLGFYIVLEVVLT